MAGQTPVESDEALIREAQAGCADAFEGLVCRYEHRVYAFVLQFCRIPADACEITQDTFVKASQGLGKFDSRKRFAPWIFTIARRTCIDRHRAATRSIGQSIPELQDDNDPAEILSLREEKQNLWRLARQLLSENQFQALWLRYAEDMEIAEIAVVFGKTLVHVRVLLFRARQSLARELRPRRATIIRARQSTLLPPTTANPATAK